ncbi:Hint domain-containing protein [Paracoccaceae bacterium Fryx2]|nr:Hint domain-containing protein [Paracoccaceae bacterium Fryx2]
MTAPKAPLPDRHALPGHACQVFEADSIFVSSGANIGDGIGGTEAACLGDVYELDRNARALRLVVTRVAQGGVQHVAPGSEVGVPGEPVRLDARFTLLAPDGDRVELLILRHGGAAGGCFALPLSPIGARIDYTLVKIDPEPEAALLADLMCVSFARGTMITLANGEQRPIEALSPGDRVLTRDHGAQKVRWVGRAALKALGAFAPVVISAGALGNAGDLMVSQHHRMFLYQRDRRSGLATSELLVQAKHLIDGDRIFLRPGGYVDYFSLVFDRHEIIYAEGIPAESLLVTEATLSRLPADLADEVKARFPGLNQNQHFGTEAGRNQLDAIAVPAPAKPPRAGAAR